MPVAVRICQRTRKTTGSILRGRGVGRLPRQSVAENRESKDFREQREKEEET